MLRQNEPNIYDTSGHLCRCLYHCPNHGPCFVRDTIRRVAFELVKEGAIRGVDDPNNLPPPLCLMSHRYPHQRQPRVDKVFAEKLKSAFSGVHISPCGHPDCPVLSDVDRAVKLLSQNIDLWAPAGSTTVLLRTPRKAMSMAGMHSSGRNSCDQVTINYGSRKSINREPLRGTLLLLQAADEEWGIFWPRKPRFEMAMAAAAQSGYTFVSQESSGNPHLITPTGELTYFHSPGDINCDVDSGGGHVCPSLYRQTTLIGTHDTCGVSNLSGVNNHCDNNTHTHTHSGYPCNVISLDHTHTHTHTYSHGHSNDTLGPMTSHQRARSEDPGQRRDELKLPLIKLKPSGYIILYIYSIYNIYIVYI
eukprot:GHVR01123125.1.p1 GENE.GHVR01123125.1~~GHVR01123125.1.p1  ORF type:complete len:362 (+),score=101.95 GHVR01123125.1:119-1204(+)